MAEKFDVAGRLAEGMPAVDNIQSLVSACHLLGYQNNELTAQAAQVRDRYASEDGLNLRALDADRAALERAVAATQEASARQDRQLAAVTDAWRGGGADASLDFLRRHADASSAATASLRTAAEALAVLRDELWRSVDGKVGAVEAIDARIAAQRAEWQAAAQTVITGDGDRSAASELIDQKVKPFVDNEIGGELSTAMRSAQASVEQAYDRATAALTGGPDVVFDVPSGFGPTWVPGREVATGGAATGETVTTPAAATPPAVSAPSPVWNAPPVAASPPANAPAPAMEPASVPPPPASGLPSMPSMGGLPDVGGGLSGFGQELADMLGGLIGSGDGDGLPDTLDDPADIDEPEDDPELDEEPEDKPELDEEPEDTDGPEDDAPVDPEVEEPLPLEEPPVVEAAPTAVPEPPPAQLPPAEPEATPAGTPCEIAATELPQVGE